MTLKLISEGRVGGGAGREQGTKVLLIQSNPYLIYSPY